jgi:hypothetical protein
VLNGVGGCTVAEAKERLTYQEALDWFAFIRKRGSLNIGMRLEAGFALLAAMYSNAHGGKGSMEDFMPHTDKEDGMSIDRAFKSLKAVK